MHACSTDFRSRGKSTKKRSDDKKVFLQKSNLYTPSPPRLLISLLVAMPSNPQNPTKLAFSFVYRMLPHG